MTNYSDREFGKGIEFSEKSAGEKCVFDGKIIKVYHDDVILPNGERAKREYLAHRGGVCVLAVDENGMVPLVRQFRYPLRTELWELPAGKLEAGEKPDEAIVRELREETGLAAEKIEFLGEFYPTVGYSNELIRVYLAKGLTFVGEKLDEDEFLELRYFPIIDLYKKAIEGDLKDGKTVFALLKYFALQR